MLEGLEASEVKLSYVCNHTDVLRLDSGYYSKEYLRGENLLDTHVSLMIKDICTSIRSFGAYSLNNFVEYIDSGIPFVRGVNLKNGVIDFSDILYISQEANKILWKSEVLPNMVLLSMSGSIGDIALALPSYNYPINSNQDIAKLELKERFSPYTLYAFLRSRFGQNYLKREARGSVQQHVFLSQIEKLRIPQFAESISYDIDKQVKQGFQLYEESTSLYSSAENYLLECLGMHDFAANSDSYNVKTLKESFLESGRIDAEFYLPKYEDYVNAVSAYAGGVAPLGKVCTINDRNYTPKHGVKYRYIELANIGKSGDITGYTYENGEDLPTRARRIVTQGDVIVSSIEGSLSSCALVTNDYDHALCSTGFYVVHATHINSETLLTLFKSFPIQQLLKKGCSGTILTGIGKQEFENIPIPLIRPEAQEEIAKHVRRSFALRKEASDLLEKAKLSVEHAIENGGGVNI